MAHAQNMRRKSRMRVRACVHSSHTGESRMGGLANPGCGGRPTHTLRCLVTPTLRARVNFLKLHRATSAINYQPLQAIDEDGRLMSG